jgi:P21-Rho-binding domain
MEHITSSSSAFDIYKLLSRRITQKLESLASTAKARIPKAFKCTLVFLCTVINSFLPSVMISTIDRRAQNDETHEISAPFNVVHAMTVRSDPTTGRLMGMPEQWTAPSTKPTTHAADQKGVSQGSFWGALRREIRAPKESLRTIQLSRSSSTSRPPVRRDSRSRRASFSEHRTGAPAAAGDYERGQIRPTETAVPLRPHNGSAPVRTPSKTARPRRKAVPKLTADEWQEINAPRIPRSHPMPQPLLTPTTFVQAPHPHPYGPTHGIAGFPREWVPMYPSTPVFFGSFDDLALPR